ncbi:MAG: hypothetical protein ACM3O4_02210 [Ignavibacteriales bacterium]
MTYEDPRIVEEKVKLIDYEIIATIIFIMATIVSVILLYNEKLDILNQKKLFSESESKTINIIRSTVILAIILFRQYINYRTKEVNAIEGQNPAPINLDIITSYFLIIAAIVALYSAYISPVEEEEGVIPLV